MTIFPTHTHNLILQKKSPASWIKNSNSEALGGEVKYWGLISMPFVICIDYKSNQSCIVLSSMSTQQLMTLPGIILFKCYFQFKSACWIILDFTGRTMVYCPRRACLPAVGWRDAVKQGAPAVPPGVPHGWGGGSIYWGSCFMLLRAQLRPGTTPKEGMFRIRMPSSCCLTTLYCLVGFNPYILKHFRSWSWIVGSQKQNTWGYLHQGNRQTLQ